MTTSDTAWLGESKKRIFFDMHLPAWPGKGVAEKFDPDALAGAIADAGADSAVLFAKCQYGNFYTAIDGERLHPGLGGLDLMGETAARLRTRGVRTIAYYSVSWDEKIADEHPEWLTENARGERGKGQWRWRTLCINSPYARVVERHLALLASRPIDGIWLDMTIIGDGNCYCPVCRERFHTATGRQPPRDETDDRFAEFLRFRYDVVESFYARIRSIVRDVSPRVAFTNNYWGYPYSSTGMGSRAVGAVRQVDFVTGEAYSDWTGIRSTSFFPLFLRGVAGGRPYEALISTSINTWGFTRKPKAYLSFEAFSLFAHGATVTVDDEPRHDGSFDEDLYRSDLREVFAELTRHRDTVRGRPLRHVAVYHSQSSRDECPDQADFVRDVSGSFRLFHDLHLPVEFVFDEVLTPEQLLGISVLALPNVTHLEDREWDILAGFMEHGGLVIASGSPGGPGGTRRMEDAFGICYQGLSRYSLSYLRLPDMCPRDLLVRGRSALYRASPSDEGCVVDPICETGPVEFFHNNLPGPHSPTTVPGLFIRRHGRGALALFPQPLYRHYAKEPERELREIIRLLVSRHCPPPLVQPVMPMKMDHAVYEDGDTLLVHLLNPGAEPSICCGLMDTMDGRFERSYEYMEEIVPVHDIRLRIRGRRCIGVETLREHASVSMREDGGETEILLDRVELWEIVKVRLAAGRS